MGKTSLIGCVEPYLELGEGEPSSGADTAVVFDGRATDDGSEFIYRSRSDGSSFDDTRISASELTTRLKRMHRQFPPRLISSRSLAV